MGRFAFILHILYTANIALLVAGVLLVRDERRAINAVLSDMTGIGTNWFLIIFTLILLFLLVGLFLVARDIGRMTQASPLAAGKIEVGALIAVLILSNAVVMPIVSQAGSYIPIVTRVRKALLKPETDFILPNPLQMSDGVEVVDEKMWMEKRRPEILALFEDEVYGKVPEGTIQSSASLIKLDPDALDKAAIRKEVILSFDNGGEHLDVNVLIYLPRGTDGPTPAFLGLNFFGNHTIHTDPGITMPPKPTDSERASNDPVDSAMSETRGSRATQWAVERILQRGYALVTAYNGDIDPDFDDGFQNGIHPLFHAGENERPAADEWGSIGAWAWGLSRIMDYLETDDDIDHTRVAVMGHSRLGKTALWAGAQDERFAIVISNNSGCMGAALSRRRYGEKISDITTIYPYWFCGNFAKYANREGDLPVDQHMLISLIAPRPVYIASADLDLWADPEGEFLAAKEAGVVYQLFGKDGLAADEQPELHEPIMGAIGYHVREGSHAVTDYDWERFMDFADMHLAPE